MVGPQPESASVRLAALDRAEDAHTYRSLLDAYARDPMGGDLPLEERILDRAVTDLRNHPTARIFIAELDRHCCGFATCFLGYSTFRARPLMNIHDIAVLNRWRGRGIGRSLLRAIADQARQEDCCKLTLEVREDNPVAQKLYAAEGFQTAEVNGMPVQYLFLEKAL